MISQNKQKGFTIVELLIVIVVIAILAAISIVAYGNVTTKSRDSQTAADAQSIAKAIHAYNQENNTWPSTGANLSAGNQAIKINSTLAGKITFQGTSATTAVAAPSVTDTYIVNRCDPTAAASAQTGAKVLYRDVAGNANKEIVVGQCS